MWTVSKTLTNSSQQENTTIRTGGLGFGVLSSKRLKRIMIWIEIRGTVRGISILDAGSGAALNATLY